MGLLAELNIHDEFEGEEGGRGGEKRMRMVVVGSKQPRFGQPLVTYLL
jgi:hypothetical protein